MDSGVLIIELDDVLAMDGADSDLVSSEFTSIVRTDSGRVSHVSKTEIGRVLEASISCSDIESLMATNPATDELFFNVFTVIFV